MATINAKFKQVKKGNRSLSKSIIENASDGRNERQDKMDDIEVLRQFDLEEKYGPCLGITRIDRWERAYKHGLDPPSRVKEILLAHQGNQDYTESIWIKYNI